MQYPPNEVLIEYKIGKLKLIGTFVHDSDIKVLINITIVINGVTVYNKFKWETSVSKECKRKIRNVIEKSYNKMHKEEKEQKINKVRKACEDFSMEE